MARREDTVRKQYEQLIKKALVDAERLAERVASGKITPNAFGIKLQAKIRRWHSRAAFLGRRLAGVPGAINGNDRRYGISVAAGEAVFVRRFVNDIRSGRYEGQAGVVARAKMYARRVGGTANEAWAGSLHPEEEVWWMLGPSENCETCLTLSKGSPYLAYKLPTYPKAGDTICLTSCECHLEVRRGNKKAFMPVKEG